MIYLNQLGIVCAAGADRDEVRRRVLETGHSGLTTTERYSPGKRLSLGCVAAALPPFDHLPVRDRSRNNRLALAALAQIRNEVNTAIERFGPARVGVVIGTSTSGIAESETALRQLATDGALPPQFHYGQQELGSPAAMLADTLGIAGPAFVHSTACASSSKALASAARLIRMDACDAVITGGVDALCAFTVAGFASLESVSAHPCNPFSANRNGVNIGEGAALFLMSREPATVSLRGWGETSDAHHISAPDPAGAGAMTAMERALQRAGIAARQIEYVNLHGTATVQNDAMEARAVHALFGERIPVSSTKPFTGHALGAAGAIEAGLCWLAMQDDNAQGRLPPHLWDGVTDTALPALRIADMQTMLGHPPRWTLSNSFAFGGANAALVFARE